MGNTMMAGRSTTNNQPEDVHTTAHAAHVLDKSAALSPRDLTAVTPVAISGSSAQSGAITATQVDLCATVAAWIVIGTNPTATTSGYYLPAGVPIRLGINAGDKVAVIGSSGTLYISPVGAL